MKLEGKEFIMEDNFRYNTRLWRMRKGLSSQAIYKLLGYASPNVITQYERYALIALAQDTKQRYADILGIPIQALYKEPVEVPVYRTDINQAICLDNLESIRKAHGARIRDFAKEIGVSRDTYYSYLRGSNISLRSFWIIVDHLGIDPWLLATGKSHNDE